MTKGLTKKRSYERTHPWLTFRFDLNRLRPADWLALGEAASKSEHIAGAALDPEIADNLHSLYLARGALATTAIEGNTLSESEVRERIDGTLRLPPSREYLGREIDNIVDACNMLADELDEENRIPLTVERIRWMNETVLRNLEVEDYVAPGRLRRTDVSVGSYRCPNWQDAEFLLSRLCTVLDSFVLPHGAQVPHAILKAIFAHLYLVWIHPFGDGNGRTARLVELAVLLEAGMPLPACHLLSSHYNLTRTEYYRQLARASRTENGIYQFSAYAIAGLVDGLRGQIEEIREHQLDVAWINFVYRRFRDMEGSGARRLRTLALALSRVREETAIDQLPNLTADLARAYANVSRRTLVRDVAALERMGLLLRGRSTVRADREQILALLPWRNRTAAKQAVGQNGSPL